MSFGRTECLRLISRILDQGDVLITAKGGSVRSSSTKRSLLNKFLNPPLAESDLITMQSVTRRLDYAAPVIAFPQIPPPLYRRRYAHVQPDGHHLGTRR